MQERNYNISIIISIFNEERRIAQADEDRISNVTDTQNPYKLPLNLESTMFIEKPEEPINCQYRLEDNNNR
jgi:hypothetical protein